MYMSTPSIDQLKRAIVIQENIDKLEAELKAVLSGSVVTAAPVQGSPIAKPAKKKKRKMSAAGRANIIAAQKARWDKIKAATAQPASAVKAVKKKAKK